MNVPPSVFLSTPWNSVLCQMEAEIVARNTMVIRARLGDKWELTWSEYRREREVDGGVGCAYGERLLFKKVMGLTENAVAAGMFSPDWSKALKEFIKGGSKDAG